MSDRNISRRELFKLSAGLATGLAGGSVMAGQANTTASSARPSLSVKDVDELWRLGAADLAVLIKDKDVSSLEALNSCLGRVEQVNGTVNAVVHIMEKEARDAATRLDKMLAGGESLGPLHGVPVSVKESVDVAGTVTSSGVADFQTNISPEDSPEIASLRRVGAIPFARTNCPDFLVRWHTHSSAYGQTFSPWKRDVTTGGSSGGEAVALATGMSPLGVGTDLGGSLRYPAQCCGISSLKPTFGRIAQSSHFSGAGSISNQMFGVSGPMARHIRDLRLGYDALSKRDRRDPWWTPAPLAFGATDTPVTVGLCLKPGDGEIHPDVLDGVKKAGEALAGAGYIVEEVQVPALQEAADLWAAVLVQEIRDFLLPTMEKHALADGVAMIRNMANGVPELDYRGYVESFAKRHIIASQWSRFAGSYPLIVGPVSTRPPYPVGEDAASEESISAIVASMRMVVPMNLLGLPVVNATCRHCLRRTAERPDHWRSVSRKHVPGCCRGDRDGAGPHYAGKSDGFVGRLSIEAQSCAGLPSTKRRKPVCGWQFEYSKWPQPDGTT